MPGGITTIEVRDGDLVTFGARLDRLPANGRVCLYLDESCLADVLPQRFSANIWFSSPVTVRAAMCDRGRDCWPVLSTAPPAYRFLPDPVLRWLAGEVFFAADLDIQSLQLGFRQTACEFPYGCGPRGGTSRLILDTGGRPLAGGLFVDPEVAYPLGIELLIAAWLPRQVPQADRFRTNEQIELFMTGTSKTRLGDPAHCPIGTDVAAYIQIVFGFFDRLRNTLCSD